MLWMTGSGINIFTIMFTGMAMINPLKSIAGVHTQFARFSDNGKVDLTQQKFQFVALNLVCLGVALYKVRPRPLPPRPPPRPSSAAAAADPARRRRSAKGWGCCRRRCRTGRRSRRCRGCAPQPSAPCRA